MHRDLKPGNVWLTEDGVANIGDFGLAMAMDHSRITQGEVMMGTLLYMSPEQVMGGEVGESSDLYSLGCLLYEMITGSPPFLGDDPLTIIGQHLNTPPVSPAWHNSEIPSGLETLLLRLLEKDPGKRPASALEVRLALESIDVESVRDPALEEPATGRVDQTPVYRKTFVGRGSELHQLHEAFNRALSGEGSLAVVVGEPGIGKTSICEQLATYVALKGGLTLVGHCYAEGSVPLPYLAFVEAARSYIRTQESDDLKREMGTGASEVARILLDVRERLNVEPSPPGDPEEARYRLMQAMASFLGNAATTRPLLLVLENLHNADRGTLDMLIHMARSLSGTRLLIVGTYRDVEVHRGHPLSGALSELRRVTSIGRIVMRGLTAEEVQRMMSRVAARDISWELAEAVHQQTEGNPLFVQEVIRYLAEEGLLTREDKLSTGQWPLSISIPEGLRDVVGKRLSRLSPECNRVLRTAAVIGQEFRMDVLQWVVGVSLEELFTALEEAKNVAVI